MIFEKDISKHGFWFRIFGYGLSFQNREKYPALFSERNGYVKVLRIGRWSIRVLTRKGLRLN